jgi:succinate dehydrogenase/fumarate reductase flavoprotein subunit
VRRNKVRPGVSGGELIGYAEAREDNDVKVDALREQIKAINQDSAAITKATADDFDVKAKDLNAVYKRYKEIKKEGLEESDYYELLALLEAEMEAQGSVSTNVVYDDADDDA